jgi:hypothetical protein
VTIPRVIVFPWAEPELEPGVVAELAEPAPAPVVVLDELQAVARPVRRVAAAAAASSFVLVGISVENLPLGHVTAGPLRP